MATLNESPSGKADKRRKRTIAPRVDLTAMVDLMFLLTTFFMLTTSLGTLNAADVAKPDECDGCNLAYPASRTMTILLGKNHKAVTYLGLPKSETMAVVPVEKIYGVISHNKQMVTSLHLKQPGKHMLVIIKPTHTSKFQDFVDVIDEMKIADIKSYAIDDERIGKVEQDFMTAKGL
ncbi:ExbD/TolR family protein [Pedobacter sandarakinus]|uniref:ExbD/TolR family protein n=1 Tax=Pedobacter sandarakinus TaxID=353156 RepID=UPI002245B39D|nr:biopolymer transporter ExbD [Pedobacter sandarakinus]MCX2573900.1 biopolymer transporter ExbD [Pedobacter sandarakinus]